MLGQEPEDRRGPADGAQGDPKAAELVVREDWQLLAKAPAKNWDATKQTFARPLEAAPFDFGDGRGPRAPARRRGSRRGRQIGRLAERVETGFESGHGQRAIRQVALRQDVESMAAAWAEEAGDGESRLARAVSVASVRAVPVQKLAAPAKRARGGGAGTLGAAEGRLEDLQEAQIQADRARQKKIKIQAAAGGPSGSTTGFAYGSALRSAGRSTPPGAPTPFFRIPHEPRSNIPAPSSKSHHPDSPRFSRRGTLWKRTINCFSSSSTFGNRRRGFRKQV